MNKIRLKLVKIILATDVLSRGIDLESVDLVINFSDPYNPENYFHRIGRTARYGRFGVSFLLMNQKKKKSWLRESQNFTKKNVKNGKIVDNNVKSNAFSSYQWNFEDWSEDKMKSINKKLKAKKLEIEAENEKNKDEKIEKVVLPSWIDAEIEHLNADRFHYQESEKPKSPKSAKIVSKSVPKIDEKIEENEDQNEGKKFEYEMLMMEIERLEKEERDLLGLKKGEQLSALHFSEQIDQENEIFIGKRSEGQMSSELTSEPIKQLKTGSNIMEEAYEADFESFKELFMMMQDPLLVENMERIDHLRPNLEKPSIFLSLVNDHLS